MTGARGTSRPGRLPFLVGYLAVSAVLVVLYYASPGHHLQLWTPLGLLSALAMVVGIRLHRPAHPVAWYLLAAATFCFILGDTTWNVLTEVLGQDNPYPSLADPLYLLTYPLFAAGLFLLIRARAATHDRGGLLDAAIVTTGVGLLVWVYLVKPYFEDEALSTLERAVSVAYPLGDVLVIGMLVRLITGGGLRNRATQFLAFGAVGLLISDVLYGLSQLRLDWNMGGISDLGWIAFYVAWGAAALHPSMGQVTQRTEAWSSEVRAGRIAVLAGFGLIAPGVLLSDALTNDGKNAVTVGVFSACLYVLVLVRLAGIVGIHKESVARERVLRGSGESLAGSHDQNEIFAATRAAVGLLTSGAARVTVSVYLLEQDDLHRVTGPAAPIGTEDVLWTSAAAGGELRRGGQLSVSPLRYDHAVRGMLVVRIGEPLTLDVHHALTTLASQLALAIERNKLAATLQQRHSEAHFSRLIQNASDVILVMADDGSFTYGMPALQRALGLEHEVGLDHLLGLVHPDDLDIALETLADIRTRGPDETIMQDVRVRHADGGYRSFEAVSKNLLTDDHVAGFVFTLRDMSHRRRLEEELKQQAFHDSLTGLANRALFQDRAIQALSRRHRAGDFVAMVVLDLDDFKDINDTHGHGAGDEVLRIVANRLTLAMRPGDTAARLGGDEFAILVENMPSASTADAVATRVLEAFIPPFVVNDEMFFMNTSAGVVVTGDEEQAVDLTELLMRADLALYAAKEAGKGRFRRYEDDLRTVMLDRVTRRTELKRAVEHNEFFLQYQPIVLVETGAIVGTEALVRWQHPRRGVVAPDDFIGLAEDTGLIVDLGRWVLWTACEQAQAWRGNPAGPLRMCVNVSGRQLEDATFVDDVREALEHFDIPPGSLVLELTETVLFQDRAAMPLRIAELRDLGVKIAIDDFGTGYSSLGYLQQFNIDILKVDKSFIDGLGGGSNKAAALARAIISMAHLLHLEIVAEGIERVEQRDDLWAIGCGMGQGYFYARPLHAHQVTDLLNDTGRLGEPAALPIKGTLSQLRLPPPPRVHAAPWP